MLHKRLFITHPTEVAEAALASCFYVIKERTPFFPAKKNSFFSDVAAMLPYISILLLHLYNSLLKLCWQRPLGPLQKARPKKGWSLLLRYKEYAFPCLFVAWNYVKKCLFVPKV